LKVAKRNTSLDDLVESAHPSQMPREQSQQEELVIQSLPKLTFEFREILVLTAYCGYEYTEIAEMLGKSIDAVRMRTSRARAQLRTILLEAMNDEARRINQPTTALKPEGHA
jgi:RNA polymerase sigma factor (sigma-70 family)